MKKLSLVLSLYRRWDVFSGLKHIMVFLRGMKVYGSNEHKVILDVSSGKIEIK